MSRGFSGGKQLIKFANAKNSGRVCLFQTTENEQLFILKTIMANYGTGVSDHCYFFGLISDVHVPTASNIDVKLEEIRPVHFA